MGLDVDSPAVVVVVAVAVVRDLLIGREIGFPENYRHNKTKHQSNLISDEDGDGGNCVNRYWKTNRV